MPLLKGANGVVFDSPAVIASGLVGGGHCEYVNADGSPSDVPVEAAEEADADKGAKQAKG